MGRLGQVGRYGSSLPMYCCHSAQVKLCRTAWQPNAINPNVVASKRMVLSELPEASVWPSGEKATELTLAEWPETVLLK